MYSDKLTFKDQMTPLERKKALSKGEAVDRKPIGMMFGSAAHRLTDLGRRDENATPENAAKVQITLYREFGIDGVGCKYGLMGMGEVFGAKMSNPEFDVPAMLEAPLKNLADVDNLAIENLTIDRDPICIQRRQALDIIREEIGGEVGVSMMFPGPFTCACALYGPENVLKAIHRKPEQLHHLLEFTLQGLKQMCEGFLRDGVPIVIADPMSSGTILNHRHYAEFSQAYAKRLVEHCRTVSPMPVSCHICGDTSAILPLMADCGFGGISLDNVVDLKTAKALVGDRIALAGNVSPVDEIHLGTPESIRAAVRKCFRDCYDSPKGFSINTGCDCPIMTPLENAYVYIDEAKRCSAYPINPENFMEK